MVICLRDGPDWTGKDNIWYHMHNAFDLYWSYMCRCELWIYYALCDVSVNVVVDVKCVMVELIDILVIMVIDYI